MSAEHPEQEFALLHRMSFWGKPSGSMNTWEYRGQTWRARRPADGQPPIEMRMRCSECHESLPFRIQSLAAMRRRKAMLRWLALIAAVIGVLGIVACANLVGIADDFDLADDVRGPASAGAGFSAVLLIVAFTTAWTLVLTAENQVGVLGSGAGSPILAAHTVQIRPPESAEEPGGRAQPE